MPARSPSQPVLIVEDNDMYRSVVVAALGQYLQGTEILEAMSVKDALQTLADHRVKVAVVDMTLPDGTALTFVDRAKTAIQAGLKIVVFSNHSREDMLPMLDRKDVHAYVEKSSGPRQLALAIEPLLAAGPPA